MATAKTGDTVQVHYTGKLPDDTIFDTSQDREPLEFVIGEGRVIPGFEQAVIDMQPDESKIVKVAAVDAYGPYRNELVIEVPRSDIPDDINPQVGQYLDIRMQNGQTGTATVKEVTDAAISLDLNHPLAGQDLTFDILLVGIG